MQVEDQQNSNIMTLRERRESFEQEKTMTTKS